MSWRARAGNRTKRRDGSVRGCCLMSSESSQDRVVVAHTADSATEAMVIRALLESAGISSPGSASSDPFPLNEVPEGSHGVEIYVLEARADDARRIIAEYLQGNNSIEETEG